MPRPAARRPGSPAGRAIRAGHGLPGAPPARGERTLPRAPHPPAAPSGPVKDPYARSGQAGAGRNLGVGRGVGQGGGAPILASRSSARRPAKPAGAVHSPQDPDPFQAGPAKRPSVKWGWEIGPAEPLRNETHLPAVPARVPGRPGRCRDPRPDPAERRPLARVVALFLVIDMIGCLPGAMAFRRSADGRIPKLLVAYDAMRGLVARASSRTVGLAGASGVGAARPAHPPVQRPGLFGNSLKSFRVSFGPRRNTPGSSIRSRSPARHSRSRNERGTRSMLSVDTAPEDVRRALERHADNPSAFSPEPGHRVLPGRRRQRRRGPPHLRPLPHPVRRALRRRRSAGCC